MISLLEKLRCGLIEPIAVTYAESTKRASSLKQSKLRNVEGVHEGGGVNSLDIENSEGRYLLCGGTEGTLFIHDLENHSGQPQYTCKAISKIDSNTIGYHKRSVETVQWYPFKTELFTSSGMDKQLNIWDKNQMRLHKSFVLREKIFQHHISPVATQHSLIAVGTTSSQVTLFDMKSGSATHKLRGHNNAVLTVNWSTNDEYILASGSCDGQILLWDIRSAGRFLCSLDQHGGELDQNHHTAHQGHVNGLRFTRDGLFLVSFGKDNRLRLWNATTSRLENVNFGKTPNGSRRTIKFDVSHHTIPELVYVPSKTNILTYDLQTGHKVNTLLGHTDSVNCCTVHPFYQELYSGANDGNLLIWTADSEQTTGPPA